MDGVRGAGAYGSLSAAVLRKAIDAPKSERSDTEVERVDMTDEDAASAAPGEPSRPIGQLGHHFDSRM